MSVLEKLFARKAANNIQIKAGSTCSFCNSKIDHFDYTQDDINLAWSTLQDSSKTEIRYAMMRSVGGKCSHCGEIFCALCYSNQKRLCSKCGAQLPPPTGGHFYMDGINYFYGTVENLINILAMENSDLCDFLDAYRIEFPNISEQDAFDDLRTHLTALIDADQIGISMQKIVGDHNPTIQHENLNNDQAKEVLKDLRHWSRPVEGQKFLYNIWAKDKKRDDRDSIKSIQISVEKTGVHADIAIVKVEGYINTITSPEFEHSLNALLTVGTFNIIVDLSKVDYISNSGWNIFFTISIKGGKIKLVRMIPTVFEVFELLQLHFFCKAFDSIEEAVADFDRIELRA